MAARKPSNQARKPKLQASSVPTVAVFKKIPHTSLRGLRCKDGLLNTSIAARSQLMRIAELNSMRSPLLLLPGEIRDKIWRYALGEHEISIAELSHEKTTNEIHDIRTLYPATKIPSGFVPPNFRLPRVCRQLYVESSPYVYTLNTFTFHSMSAFDRWIKNRCLGQRRLIASVDVPRTYTRLYRSGLRKSFRQKFPNIQRVGIDNWTLFCEYDQNRRLLESKQKGAIDTWNDARAKIIAEVKKKEGQQVVVAWHGKSY